MDAGNIYLNKVYKSLLLLYYDKFGEEGFEDFAYRLIIIFTHYGFEKAQVRKEGIINSFAKPYSEKINLYNLIFSKYYPVLVKENLDRYIQFEIDDKTKENNEEIEISKKLETLNPNTRLGRFVNRWYNNNKIKEKIFKILDDCGRNWKTK